MKIRVYWDNSQKKMKAGLHVRHLIKKAIRGTLECEKFMRDIMVSVSFTDNDGIKKLNSEYRNIDSATDVLSFPMFDMKNGDLPEEDGTVELGDIVLSLERAAAQAEEYGHSYEREVAFLTVHSMLHLLGYDHVDSEEDEMEMREHQRIIMKHIGLERKQENEDMKK